MNQVDCLERKERLLGDWMDNGIVVTEEERELLESERELAEDECNTDSSNEIIKLEEKHDKTKSTLYNQGFGVVEVILLIVIIVALIIIFRDKIQEIFDKAMSALTQSTDSILNRVTPTP